MTKLTPEDVARLRAKATAGPWENGDTAVYSSKGFMVADRGMTNIGANMDFIAAAHDMADLVADMAAAHAENARILGYLVNELQGLVPAGKLAALEQCRERAARGQK